MRLMRYVEGGREGLALSHDGSDWVGLASDHPRYPGPIIGALPDPDVMARLVRRLEDGAPVDPAHVMILPPVPLSGKVLCIESNHTGRLREAGLPVPTKLSVSARFAASLVGQGAPLLRPQASEQFDYAAELAAIIGLPARHVGRATALDHVAGYTLFNDGTIRDGQMRSALGMLGKNHDASGAIGPWMVTADALPPGGRGLRLTGRLNGTIVQDGDTADLVVDLARIIEHLSAIMTLEPGDIIAMGTPSGGAMRATPPRWLRPGDVFEVSVDGIGTLSNPVIDERP